MNITTWISLGIVGIAIAGILLLLNQITKPYDVKTEEEFEKRRKESAGFMVSGMRGIQELLDRSIGAEPLCTFIRSNLPAARARSPV